MIEPLRRASILRASAWQDRNTPATLTSCTFCHVSSDKRLGRFRTGDAGIVDGDGQRAEFGLDAIDCRREIALAR